MVRREFISKRGEVEMYDFAIVGGGIVGLSTGYALTKRYPGAKITIIVPCS